jgi:DNA-binding Lrp family transcriptional regulator
MRWSATEEKYLKKLYLNTSLTLNEIAQRLKRTPAAINHRLAKMRIKRRLSPVSRSPKKMIPA